MRHRVLPTAVIGLALTVAILPLSGCKRQPPSQRPNVMLPAYTKGDSEKGKALYETACEKCHRLQPGNNEKGPQLMRIYGAQSALLSDYQYTDALKNSHQTWTADALDAYIADPKKAIPGTRMRSEPIANARDREDIIAYLSTLR